MKRTACFCEWNAMYTFDITLALLFPITKVFDICTTQLLVKTGLRLVIDSICNKYT